MQYLRQITRRLFNRLKKRSYGLNGLDLKLRPYLDFKNGFFIEAGANDGISQSNTYFYEKYFGWKGVLIEPIPKLAKRCEINRPRCIIENCALVSCDYPKSSIEMFDCNLMSLVKGSKSSREEELDFLKAGCEVQNIDYSELTVPAKTLTSLLDAYAINHVDFFSLDVEGYELNVLKGIDFEKHRPRLMLIETSQKDAVEAFINPLYEPIAQLSHHDILYRSKT